MAISKIMKSALKALSYTEPDIKKTYKLERHLSVIGTKKKNKKNHVSTRNRIKISTPKYVTWDHKIYCENYSIPVRMFTPTDEKYLPGEFPILLFFHGGGFVKGNIDSYSKVCSNMARLTKHLVVSVDYRLAPEHKYPAAVLDCYNVALELFTKAELLNISPERITLIGDSAGANLAAAVSLMAHDKKEFSPPKQILIYPATYNDHSATSPFPSIRENGTDYLLTSKRICDYFELYVGSNLDYSSHYFAPLLAEDISNQPETLIITAEFDPLRDEGEAYAHKLLQGGNRVELHRINDALHGFFSLPPYFEQVKATYGIINNFLGV